MRFKRTLKYVFKRLLVVFLLCLILRIFFFEIFAVPSDSMENTAYKGDFLYVNKLYFGPRLPKNLREVPWLNILPMLFNRRINEVPTNFSANYRIAGLSKIKRNDILVFNQPLNQEGYFLKRCIGLPGDSLNLSDSNAVVNGLLFDTNSNIKMTYYVSLKPNTDYIKLFKSLNIPFKEGWFERSQTKKTVALTLSQKKLLKSNPFVLGIIRQLSSNSLVSDMTQASTFDQEMYRIHVPFKNMKVSLDSVTFKLYQDIINKFEEVVFKKKGNKYFLNDSIVETYTFKNNYYFMMGDNRDYSLDSRAWGFMPEFCIIGRAEFVVFSKNTWKRTFKRLY